MISFNHLVEFRCVVHYCATVPYGNNIKLQDNTSYVVSKYHVLSKADIMLDNVYSL